MIWRTHSYRNCDFTGTWGRADTPGSLGTYFQAQTARQRRIGMRARIEFLSQDQHARLKALQCNADLQSIYRFQSRHGFNLSCLRIPNFHLLSSSDRSEERRVGKEGGSQLST